MRPDKRAFTLVELVITLIIIGILSALVISFTAKAPEKAAIQEARAAMEALRIQLKEYFYAPDPETGQIRNRYPWAAGEKHFFDEAGVPELLNLKTGDLKGTHFSDGSYQIEIQSNDFWIYCIIDDANNNFFKRITDDHSGKGSLDMNSSGQIFHENISI